MSAPDWRTIPGLLDLAEIATRNGVAFSQAKFDRLWQLCEEAGVPPLLPCAILIQEGTGSFDTKAGAGGDGGGGVEPDWELDVRRMVNFVRGKLSLYIQAVDHGFGVFASQVISPGDGKGYPADGGPVEYCNWYTPILRTDGTVDIAVYAQHASWWVGVQAHYLRMGGNLKALWDAAAVLDKQAPRVQMAFRVVTDETGLASNWNAQTPEPAVVATEASIITPAPEPEPAPKPCVVHLPGTGTVIGELRGDVAWVQFRGTWMPVRLIVEAMGKTPVFIPSAITRGLPVVLAL